MTGAYYDTSSAQIQKISQILDEFDWAHDADIPEAVRAVCETVEEMQQQTCELLQQVEDAREWALGLAQFIDDTHPHGESSVENLPWKQETEG